MSTNYHLLHHTMFHWYPNLQAMALSENGLRDRGTKSIRDALSRYNNEHHESPKTTTKVMQHTCIVPIGTKIAIIRVSCPGTSDSVPCYSKLLTIPLSNCLPSDPLRRQIPRTNAGVTQGHATKQRAWQGVVFLWS